ncbi:phage terminase small subunit P27 family [Pseudomonas japonica]|uniref:phage terminase small subunit P27 family n=1 Tax=Pseudomonas japonica TaxID=256466 RepID=UPI003A8AA094
MGRPAKPTALKVLQGNPGKRKLNKSAPAPTPLAEVPAPPEWLGEWAIEMWETIAPWLTQTGIMTRTDTHNLAVFCAAYDRWRQAEVEVAEAGITVVDVKGVLKKNPACTVINEALRQLASFGAALGLDPASRARLMGNHGQEKPANPFLLLKGGKGRNQAS